MRLVLACLAVVFLLHSTAFAAKDSKRKGDPAAAIKKKLDAAGLATDKLGEAKKIVDEHAAKLKEAQTKVDGVLTAEQKAAAKSARKAAKAAGKERKAAKAEIQAALKLTDEQKTRLATAEKELADAKQAVAKSLSSVLTKEQLGQAGFKTRKKKNS
jgi:hypothetical protein